VRRGRGTHEDVAGTGKKGERSPSESMPCPLPRIDRGRRKEGEEAGRFQTAGKRPRAPMTERESAGGPKKVCRSSGVQAGKKEKGGKTTDRESVAKNAET